MSAKQSVDRRAAMLAGIALALRQAEDDFHAGVSETERPEGGRLDTMFRVSGYSPFTGVSQHMAHGVPEWCGMAVVSWLIAGGFNPCFNTSFLHTFNVEAFFTYGTRRMVNRRRHDSIAIVDGVETPIVGWHRGAGMMRRWLDRARILDGLATVEPNPDLFAPGDVVLIDWSGRNDADHITIVRDWDPVTKVLRTWEGNRSGLDAAGRPVRDAVVCCRYDLTTAADRRIIYGGGRTSPLDWGHEEAR